MSSLRKLSESLLGVSLMPPYWPIQILTDPSSFTTDASLSGLGVVLYQVHEGQRHPVVFASQSLVPSETRFPGSKIRVLAATWAVTEKFWDYLYGTTVQVWTDNNPLIYILTSAKPDATGHLWVADVDALSQMTPAQAQEVLQPQAIQALYDLPMRSPSGEGSDGACLAEVLEVPPKGIPQA